MFISIKKNINLKKKIHHIYTLRMTQGNQYLYI